MLNCDFGTFIDAPTHSVGEKMIHYLMINVYPNIFSLFYYYRNLHFSEINEYYKVIIF